MQRVRVTVLAYQQNVRPMEVLIKTIYTHPYRKQMQALWNECLLMQRVRIAVLGYQKQKSAPWKY